MQQKSNWSDSNDLALMFANTFKPAFYRQLHKYVHKSFRKQIAIDSFKGLLNHPENVNATVLKKILSSLYFIPAALLEQYKLKLVEKA